MLYLCSMIRNITENDAHIIMEKTGINIEGRDVINYALSGITLNIRVNF